MSDGDNKVVRRKSVDSTSDKPAETKTDFESMMEKIPYPKAVFFIVVCEFCERFCYYGMRAVLTLYFKNVLKWDEDFATVIYHVWVMLCYFSPLVGAMLADSLLGKFRTIFYLSVVYCCGSIVLSLAATPPLSIPTVAFSMIGLALISLGTGGIKPCVAAFGGDQFKIPGQESQLESYFAVFYFAINSGSLLTQILTPIFREDISCFGDDTCFPLAFSVPAGLMIVALVIFLAGRPLYKIVKPEGNVVLQIMKAVVHSLGRRGKEVKAGKKRNHWLDYADDKFDQRFLDEAKVVFKVLFLYLPLPIFWTLFDQQGSRWTFQATRMNGRISGSFGVKADQMQVANPILVLIFIPIFDRIIYPMLGKCHLLKSPLQRLGVGLIFAGVSFVVSGIIELTIVPTYAVELATGESNFHLVNHLPCDINITVAGGKLDEQMIKMNEVYLYEEIETGSYDFNIKRTGQGCDGLNFDGKNFKANLKSENATTFILMTQANAAGTTDIVLKESNEPDDLEKSDIGLPKLKVVFAGFPGAGQASFIIENSGQTNMFMTEFNSSYTDTAWSTETREMQPEEYNLYMIYDGIPQGIMFSEEKELKFGGSYVATVVRKPGTDGTKESDYNFAIHEITTPNTVHMLWQLPQFLIMTMGEIMFSITIMDFSYTESPPNMKSVMQSAWLLTVAFGNLIVVIIAEIKIFNEQWKEFFLFAGIMFADVIIYGYLAWTYTPTDKFWLRDNEKKKEEKKEDEAIEN